MNVPQNAKRRDYGKCFSVVGVMVEELMPDMLDMLFS